MVSLIDLRYKLFVELLTTVVEAWYCYCSVDSIIMDLFCHLLSVEPTVIISSLSFPLQ